MLLALLHSLCLSFLSSFLVSFLPSFIHSFILSFLTSFFFQYYTNMLLNGEKYAGSVLKTREELAFATALQYCSVVYDLCKLVSNQVAMIEQLTAPGHMLSDQPPPLDASNIDAGYYGASNSGRDCDSDEEKEEERVLDDRHFNEAQATMGPRPCRPGGYGCSCSEETGTEASAAATTTTTEAQYPELD
jgi:hypothetical protein